jgi:hypothetical protein
MHLLGLVVGLAAVGISQAAPSLTGTPTYANSTACSNGTQTIQPCAAVSQAAEAYAAANPGSTVMRVPAGIAMECLKSVPLDIDGEYQKLSNKSSL